LARLLRRQPTDRIDLERDILRRVSQMASTALPTTTSPGPLVLPALCLGAFISLLTLSAPAPFLPDIASELGVSVPVVGQVTAAMLILSAPLGLIAGPVADRYGARRLILIGLAASAVCMLIFGLATVFPLLFIASAAGALSEATVPGLTLAVGGTRYRGPASRRAIGWIVAAASLAPIVGVPFLTTISGIAGWRAGFLVGGCIALIILLVATAWLPEDVQRPGAAFRPATLLDAYRPLLHDIGMRRLYGCSVMRSLCWFGMITYLGAALGDRFGISTSEVGIVYMLVGSGYLAGSLVAGRALARFHVSSLVAVGNSVMGLMLMTALSGMVGFRIAIGLLSIAAFAGAVGWVGLTALLTSETPAGAGTTMVLNGSLYNIGAAIGAGLGGILLATGGVSALAFGLPLFGLGSALCVWVPRRPLIPDHGPA
jgi:DHA1 family inner membrane transport protein